MVKIQKGSRIEIWCANYINNPKTRRPEDRNVEIVQIEHIEGTKDYIVEVI